MTYTNMLKKIKLQNSYDYTFSTLVLRTKPILISTKIIKIGFTEIPLLVSSLKISKIE